MKKKKIINLEISTGYYCNNGYYKSNSYNESIRSAQTNAGVNALDFLLLFSHVQASYAKVFCLWQLFCEWFNIC
jgi:hypothetical protein